MTDPSVCACCGNRRTRRRNGCWKGAHNWCHTCTELYYAQGKPPGGPCRSGPERIRRIRQTTRSQQAARVQDYAWLVAFGETREQAAAQVGVSVRTARRVYDRMLAAAESQREEMAA